METRKSSSLSFRLPSIGLTATPRPRNVTYAPSRTESKVRYFSGQASVRKNLI